MTTATLAAPDPATLARKRRHALKRSLNRVEALRVLALFGDHHTQTRQKLKRLYPSTPHWERLVEDGLIHAADPTRPELFSATEVAAALADWVSQQQLQPSTAAAAVLRQIRQANFNSFRISVLTQTYQNGGRFPDGIQIHPSPTMRDAVWAGLRTAGVLVNQELTPLGVALAQWYSELGPPPAP